MRCGDVNATMSDTNYNGTQAHRVRVKICGLTCETDRDAAVAAGADALGFIVDVPVDTPRELSPERAAGLVAGAPPLVSTVLVTMPKSVEDGVTLQERVGADTVQVHGGLSPAEVKQLGDRLDTTIIVAVDVHDEDVETYAAASDALLVDSTDERGAGGTGETHDWERTRSLVERLDTPVILAGGLTPENVERAVETVEPFAVDTATGVEREGGRKDHDAVARFVHRTRQAEVSV